MTNHNDITTLLRKYISGILTSEEEEILKEMVIDPDKDESIKQSLQQLIAENENNTVRIAENWEYHANAILALDKTPVRKMNRFSAKWIRYAAAILIICIAVYLWSGKEKSSSLITHNTVAANNDVPPGGNKAILTLANGSTIILDSADNGMLVKVGNIQVIKPGNGQLKYLPVGKNGNELSYNTMTTPRGGEYQLTLSDGTRVWLNAASSITFPTSFTGVDRKVSITGEVYFEVAKHAGIPFEVTANRPVSQGGDLKVQVLGTHFNINSYPEESTIKTSLLEGSVRINDQLTLKVGEEAESFKNGKLSARSADVTQSIAWKEGLFLFNSSDIESVMRQVARWYDIEVIYHGKKPADRFTGKIKRSVTLNELLKILAYSNVHFKLEANKLIVLP